MSKDAFQRILAADDGSQSGEHAALIALKLGAKLKAEVILLGVVAPPNIQAAGEGLPIEDPSICRRTMEARFERFLNLGKSLGVDMMLEIVEGRPAEQIQKRAKDGPGRPHHRRPTPPARNPQMVRSIHLRNRPPRFHLLRHGRPLICPVLPSEGNTRYSIHK